MPGATQFKGLELPDTKHAELEIDLETLTDEEVLQKYDTDDEVSEEDQCAICGIPGCNYQERVKVRVAKAKNKVRW